MPVERVVVVDDSPTARMLLRSILHTDPAIEVVGEAATGAEAVELVKRVRPSIVVMDVEMPEMDGFEATKRIMIEEPTPIIIVTGTDDALEVEVGLKAVGAGALTALRKPPGLSSPQHAAEAARLIRLVKALADVKVVRQRRRASPAPLSTPPPGRMPAITDQRADRPVQIVGVAASTGGPAALYRFLAALPRSLDVPVLVVQHIAPGFVDGLARWLATATVLPVSVARAHTPLCGGDVYLAPDDRHLAVRDGRIALSPAVAVGGFRPAANVLFRSLADSYGDRCAVVVLTGMGEDGVDGASEVHAAGGLVIAQDAGTSTVFGMPRAVVANGVADAVGTVEQLASRIANLAPHKEASA